MAHLREPLRQEKGGGVREGVGVGVEVRVEVRVEKEVRLKRGVNVEASVRVDVGKRVLEAGPVSERSGDLVEVERGLLLEVKKIVREFKDEGVGEGKREGDWKAEEAGLLVVVGQSVRELQALVFELWVARVERDCVEKVDWDGEGMVEGESVESRDTVGVLVPSTCTAPAAGPDALLQSAPAAQAPEQAEVVKPVVLP